jgi:hypothetical protein
MSELELVKEYYFHYTKQCEISEKLKTIYKKGRKPNFPEFVSEFLAKQVCNATKPKSGDLCVKNYRIEVKCFASRGPVSFGPEEKWDIIIFLDATQGEKISFLIYNISNDSPVWKNIKLNKTQTFASQAQQRRRPRITFSNLTSQLPKPNHILNTSVSEVFSGQIPKIEIEL